MHDEYQSDTVDKTKGQCETSYTSEKRPEPTLLGLPGELRNQIYRYALQEDRHTIHVGCGVRAITIEEHNHKAPALLRTSRQLRAEAKSIYHDENKFTVLIYNLKFQPQREHWVWETTPFLQTTDDFLFHDSVLHWDNFVDGWLKSYWGEMVDDDHGSDADFGLNWQALSETICAEVDRPEYWGARDILETLADDKIRWETVLRVLANFRNSMSERR